MCGGGRPRDAMCSTQRRRPLLDNQSSYQFEQELVMTPKCRPFCWRLCCILARDPCGAAWGPGSAEVSGLGTCASAGQPATSEFKFTVQQEILLGVSTEIKEMIVKHINVSIRQATVL